MIRLLPLAGALIPFAALASVNVNTAQQSELQRTQGFDKHKAKAIIEWRNAHGSIDTFQELAEVPGFTPEFIEKVKPQIAFSGDPWTPPPKPAAKKKR